VKGRAIELTGSVEVLLSEAVWALKGSEPQRLLARTVEELGPGGQRDGNWAEAERWFVADPRSSPTTARQFAWYTIASSFHHRWSGFRPYPRRLRVAADSRSEAIVAAEFARQDSGVVLF